MFNLKDPLRVSKSVLVDAFKVNICLLRAKRVLGGRRLQFTLASSRWRQALAQGAVAQCSHPGPGQFLGEKEPAEPNPGLETSVGNIEVINFTPPALSGSHPHTDPPSRSLGRAVRTSCTSALETEGAIININAKERVKTCPGNQ